MRDFKVSQIPFQQDCEVKFLADQIKVAVNVSGGEQTFPQIMADFSLFVH